MANSGKYYESQFEEATIELLQQSGWRLYSFGGDLHRKVTDALIESDLKEFISARYADQSLSNNDIERIVANLRNSGGATDYLSLVNTVNLYRDGFDFTFNDADRQPFHFNYIDFDTPGNNIFRVVNQFEMHQGQQTRIPDILLFVNGIPVGIFELKNPTDEKATIRDAHTQISVRYRRDIPSLMKYCAVAVVSDGSNTRLGASVSAYEYFYAWKKVNNEDLPGMGIKELETLIEGALAPERLLEILRDYVYFPDTDEENDKELEVVCRYPQFFATRKLRDHIIAHLRSRGGDGKGGTYFGATGCGKTFTMLFLARQLALRCKSSLGSPTIVLIVDREDLETQAGKLFCASKTFLADKEVRVFESRNDLGDELNIRKSGGFYITTIQKFSEKMGLLSERSNIICMSDEAHRSQNNLGSKLKIRSQESSEGKGDIGAFISYGFAKYLRTALPNATYVGFTGTPIDETIHVFGEEVDRYTMLQAQEDEITVPIKYDPRLARVFLDKEQAEKVEEYYRLCEKEDASPEDIDRSKKAMSSLQVILGDDGRLSRVAADIVKDYETRIADNPDLLQKAMVVCSDRKIAFTLYKKIVALRPDWGEEKKALDETPYSEDELAKLVPTRFVNVVATRDKNDPKDMYDFLGDKSYRKSLDELYKREDSNFHIAIVVDMWITGFDCPPLTYLYNDKPLQKHTLIQTISRVNRKYKTKEVGVIIDYIGIRENMKKAMKRYGGDGGDTPKDDVETALKIFRNELKLLQEMTSKLDFSPFFEDNALLRLQFLQTAAEFILANTIEEKGKVSYATTFKGHVRRLRAAYGICHPAGVLEEEETTWAQCFMGIYSFLKKITSGHHDVDSMNQAVEQMVKEALNCTGIETILGVQDEEEIFGDSFLKELDDIKMPHTKFQLLVQMLQKAIKEYSKTNKVRAEHFAKLLEETVDEYNTRDKLTFTNDIATDTINSITETVNARVGELTDKLLELFNALNKDKEKFKELGITFEEKAFYDILVEIRDTHGFEYANDRCITLARKIKELIDNSSLYADWLNNFNLRDQLASDLTVLIYKEGYPPEWDEEVFERVLEQVENFKKNN